MFFMFDTRFLPTECRHEAKWWIIPWCGECHWGPHPVSKGKQMMIPFDVWTQDMLQWREPNGAYLTRAAAAYSTQMNRELAMAWLRSAAVAKLERTQTASMVTTGKW